MILSMSLSAWFVAVSLYFGVLSLQYHALGCDDADPQDQVATMTTPVNTEPMNKKDSFEMRMGSAVSMSTPGSESVAENVEMVTKDVDPKESSTVPLIVDST